MSGGTALRGESRFLCIPVLSPGESDPEQKIVPGGKDPLDSPPGPAQHDHVSPLRGQSPLRSRGRPGRQQVIASAGLWTHRLLTLSSSVPSVSTRSCSTKGPPSNEDILIIKRLNNPDLPGPGHNCVSTEKGNDRQHRTE